MKSRWRYDDPLNAVDACRVPRVTGKITVVKELHMEALLPGVGKGARLKVSSRGRAVLAEVVSLDGPTAGLVPLSSTSGVAVGDSVEQVGEEDFIFCGSGLVGRIVDSLGNPLDGKGPIENASPWMVNRAAPGHLSRLDVDEQLITGIRVIDGCLALGKGQRLGLTAGPGMGKSTLLGTLAARASADVSIICLVGERGREVREFIDDVLQPKGLERSLIVIASADDPPMLRAKALSTATAAAEWFRANGDDVLLLVDSLTRVVRARRDVALAFGDMPARRGYPSAAFAQLPSLFERVGRDKQGSITAVYAVLTESSDEDPVAEEVRSLADGHIVLSEKLAQAGRWPAVDLVASVSRVMPRIVGEEQYKVAGTLRRVLSAYQENEDLILMGAYRTGTCPDTDAAIKSKKEIEGFLRQAKDHHSSAHETRTALVNLAKSI